MMKHMIILISLVLLSFPALAQKGSGSSRKVFFRVQLGQLFATPSSFNDEVEGYLVNTPDIKGAKFNSIDLIYLFDSAVYTGVRYEILDHTYDANGGVASAKLKGERINGIVGWQFLRFQKAYLSLNAQVSVAPVKFNYDVSITPYNSPTNEYKFRGKLNTGYAAGLEGVILFENRYPVGQLPALG